MNPENSSFQDVGAGTGALVGVAVPAFVWLHRCRDLRNFLLLYRDLASSERNVWAVAHLDSLVLRIADLERRAGLEQKQESLSPWANPAGVNKKG